MTLRSISNLSSSSLFQAFQECREVTLALFQGVDYQTFCRQAHPDFSPIGWHLGHIAYTEALWILQRLAGHPPLFPHYHRLFAQDGLLKCDRVNLPPIAEVLDYLEIVRTGVLDYLAIAPLEQQERILRWLVQHESQHAETISIVLALIGATTSKKIDARLNETDELMMFSSHLSSTPQHRSVSSPKPTSTEMIFIPAGEFQQGNESVEALDNERPIHSIYVNDYWIDRYPVTHQDYRSFIQAGGYQNPQWWSQEGWQWLQTSCINAPLYWTNHSTYDNHPVCGVSWYEADAYARFVGKRLPTESEWEKAASWNPATQERFLYPWGNQDPDPSHCNHQHFVGTTTPIDRYSQGKSPYGCYDMLGNVWEWTSTWFEGYPGFECFPYPGYSQTYFDRAHRVLKGSSWATCRWSMRNPFRNWYHPHIQQVFAGFRCAK
jgi:ergothioneine biosynthesis protein EgtB